VYNYYVKIYLSDGHIMLDDIVFKADDVTLENLEHLKEELSCLKEQIRLEISDVCVSACELAFSLSDMGMSAIDFLEFLKNELSAEGSNGDGNISVSEGFDKASFSELFLEALQKRGLTLSEEDFLTPQKREESFTYVKNAFADEAYDVFSQEFTEPRISSYSKNFRECAQKVLDGECGYCILPLEEKGGVRLPSVSELLYTTELKINSVTPVFGFDGNAGLKYALLSRGFSVPKGSAQDDRYLEIRFRDSLSVELKDLLSALSAFGHSVYRISSVISDGAQTEEKSYSVVIRDDGKSFLPLLVYLFLFSFGFVPIGIYKNLE